MQNAVFRSYIGEIIFCFEADKLFAMKLPYSYDSSLQLCESNELSKLSQTIFDETANLLNNYFDDCANFRLFQSICKNWIMPERTFTQRVHLSLIKIKAGRTISYKKLAENVGNPFAARAVGNAMRSNRFPLLIPCHRVIMSSGGLGGYSAAGGLTLKQRLLDWELQNMSEHRKIPREICKF